MTTPPDQIQSASTLSETAETLKEAIASFLDLPLRDAEEAAFGVLFNRRWPDEAYADEPEAIALARHLQRGEVFQPWWPEGRGAGGSPRPSEAPRRRRPTDRGGFVNTKLFSPIVVPVATVVQAGGEAAKYVIDNAVRDVVDRVRQYDTPSARQAADQAEAAINTAKAALGKLAPQLDRALKLTGGGVSLPLHKALASLQTVNRPAGKSYGTARLVDMVEGRATPRNAYEKGVVQAIQKLTEATGQMLHANGVQQRGPGGDWHLFKPTPGGKAFLRNYTPEGAAIIMRGPAAPGWREWVDAVADLNDIAPASVEKTMREMRAEMLIEGADGAFKRVNAEFTRQYERVPTHLYVHGDVVPVLQTFPFLYVKSLAENTAARVGFVKHFGQSIGPEPKQIAAIRKPFRDQLRKAKADYRQAVRNNRRAATKAHPGDPKAQAAAWKAANAPVRQGYVAFVSGARKRMRARVEQYRAANEAPLNKLRRQYLAENGDTRPLVQLMRALNNVPVEPPLIEAGSGVGQLVRTIRTTGQLFKAGLLSLSTVQNLAEPLGNVQAFSGSGDLFKAVWNLTRHPQATIATLESLGAVTKDVASLAFQPGRGYGSAVRILSEASGRAFLHKYVNELQEKLAAAVALEKVERMQEGKGNAGDVFDLVSMGWDQLDARRLALGKGTQAEYNKVVRQAPTKLVGNPMGGAERTRLSHNRLYHAVVAFEAYAQMKIRGFVKQLEAFGKTMRRGTARERLAAVQKVARYQVGTAAAGSLSYFLLAMVTGGAMGLEIAWNEAKDHPVRFLRDSWLYTMFAGPYGAIIRNATRGDSAQWLDALLPVFLVRETTNAIAGSGAYDGLSATQRAGKLLNRLAPVQRAVATAAAAIGFGREQHRLEVAKRAYWRWRFEKYPPGHFEREDEPTAQDQRFRDAMKQAYTDILKMRDPSGHVAQAFETGKEGKSLAASMRARLLLSKGALQAKSDEQAEERRQELRKRIGDEAYRELEGHDQILGEWAEVLNLSDGDAETAADYRQRYGARLVDLERQRKATPEGTIERDELDNRANRIDYEMGRIRKAPAAPEQRREARDAALDFLLLPLPTGTGGR